MKSFWLITTLVLVWSVGGPPSDLWASSRAGAGVSVPEAARWSRVTLQQRAEPAPQTRPAVPARGARRENLGSAARSGMTAAEVEQLFDRYVLGQARAALQLTPSQMTMFAPQLRNLQMTRRRVQRERQRLLNELAAESRRMPSDDDSAVAERLRAVDAHRSAADERIRAAMAGVDDVLTVPQRARFRIFERRIERQKLELLARARAEARAGAAPEAQPTGEP